MGSEYKKLITSACLLVYTSFFIWFNSYYTADGGLDIVAKNFFRLIENLTDKNGLFINDLYSNSQKSLFSYWLYGYAYVIFYMQSFFDLDIFLTSKISNVIFIVVFLYFMSFYDKKNIVYYLAILLFYPILPTLFYSNYLLLFSLLAIMLITQIIYFLEYKINIIEFIIFIILVSAFLFISYHSLFIILATFGAIIYCFVNSDRKKIIYLFIALFLELIIEFYILNHNYLQSEKYFGIEPEFNLQHFEKLLIILNPIIDYFFLIITSFFIVKYIAKTKQEKFWNDNNSPLFQCKALLLSGDLYSLVLLILLVYGIADINIHSITFLFVIWSCVFIKLLEVKITKKYFNIIIIIILFMSNAYYWIFLYPEYKGDYQLLRNTKEEQINLLEYNSIVFLGDSDLIYLGDNSQPMHPYPFYNTKSINHIAESLEEFLNKNCKISYAANIYADLKILLEKKDEFKSMHESFINYINDIEQEKDQHDRYILLKQCVVPVGSI